MPKGIKGFKKDHKHSQAKKLKPYVVSSLSLGSREGACLVFAYSIKEAKKLGYPIINDWFDIEWIDCGVAWLKNKDWLFEEKRKDEPHVIENPKVCELCGVWGNEPFDDHICMDCEERITQGVF